MDPKEGSRPDVGDLISVRVNVGALVAHRERLKAAPELFEALAQNRPGYTSVAFGNRCKEAGVRPSTGSVGDAYDNAMCESFFATLECELIDRRRFRSHSEARMAVFQFIESFYNPSRRHSDLGYLSPIEYERKHDGLSKPAQAPTRPSKRGNSRLA